MALEQERKYLDVNINALRKKLAEIGAASQGAHFEQNLILDTTEFALTRAGKLLRLRLQEWPGKKNWVLTLKMPGQENDLAIKIREEFETCVSDGENAIIIFSVLGFQEIARYEKIRESWRWKTEQGQLVKLDLDHLPFCDCLEIEGNADAIASAEKRLHLDKFRISTKSYYELHHDWLLQHNLPETANIVFNEDEKNSLRSLLNRG